MNIEHGHISDKKEHQQNVLTDLNKLENNEIAGTQTTLQNLKQTIVEKYNNNATLINTIVKLYGTPGIPLIIPGIPSKITPSLFDANKLTSSPNDTLIQLCLIKCGFGRYTKIDSALGAGSRKGILAFKKRYNEYTRLGPALRKIPENDQADADFFSAVVDLLQNRNQAFIHEIPADNANNTHTLASASTNQTAKQTATGSLFTASNSGNENKINQANQNITTMQGLYTDYLQSSSYPLSMPFSVVKGMAFVESQFNETRVGEGHGSRGLLQLTSIVFEDIAKHPNSYDITWIKKQLAASQIDYTKIMNDTNYRKQKILLPGVNTIFALAHLSRKQQFATKERMAFWKERTINKQQSILTALQKRLSSYGVKYDGTVATTLLQTIARNPSTTRQYVTALMYNGNSAVFTSGIQHREVYAFMSLYSKYILNIEDIFC